jgi:hypothetical protein|tara:strand:+ start:127 stop:498 length:372 start_codon:yes stop_codon:yes gene_type:complete
MCLKGNQFKLKKGKSMKFLTIFLLTILVSIQAQELKQKPEVSIQAQELKQKPEKDSKFLEIKVDNPDLQAEIDNLKKQYDLELNELKIQFKEQKKSLRKSYKGRLKELRKRYKKQKIKKKNKK